MNWENEVRRISNINNKSVHEGNRVLANKCFILLKRYMNGERTEELFKQMQGVKYGK